MARVMLVNANWGGLFSGRVRRYNRRFPPLDLLNCAALLRAAGHQVELHDCRTRPDAREAVVGNGADLTVVALSSLDRWQCPNTDLEHLDRFLEGIPMERTVLYGAQATLRPDAMLRRTGASGVLLGEPESSVLDVAAGARPGDVDGTLRLEGEGTVGGERKREIPLTSLPVPAFDLLDFSDYSYEVLGGRFGLLELTRGCPWRCKFCLLDMYGKKYRRKSVDQMLGEIRVAMGHGMRCAYFQDLEFTLDHDLVGGLCEALLSAGIKLRWACQTRPDTVNASLLALLKRAGCELIHYGVESGVPEIAKATGKRQPLEEVERAVAEAHAVGMRTLCYFLIGMPGEQAEHMLGTLDFARRLNPTYASFQVATPYPSTPWHREHFSADDQPLFPTVFDGPLDETELRALAQRLTARFHLRPRYLATRLLGPGRRAAVREAGLLARYLLAR